MYNSSEMVFGAFLGAYFWGDLPDRYCGRSSYSRSKLESLQKSRKTWMEMFDPYL